MASQPVFVFLNELFDELSAGYRRGVSAMTDVESAVDAA